MKGYQAQGVTKDLRRGKLLARLGMSVDVWEDTVWPNMSAYSPLSYTAAFEIKRLRLCPGLEPWHFLQKR